MEKKCNGDWHCEDTNCPTCHQPQVKDSWRENVHANLNGFLGYPTIKDIPQPIIDAIDAAYVAGLDRDAEEVKDLLAQARKKGAMEAINAIPENYIGFAVDKMNLIGSRACQDIKQQLTSRFGKEE